MKASMDKAHCALRCSARSKRTGLPCRAPAVKGWSVCRMHGAGGGAPEGSANPNWRHGGRNRETVLIRSLAATLRRAWRDTSGDLEGDP